MRPKPVNGLPFKTRVYINNQVLLPASLIKTLGIEGADYADVVIKYGDKVIEVRNAKLLRTRRTASRQFTIPREVREKYGVGPLDEVEIVQVKPKSTMEVIKDLDAQPH
jgi:bifunctional DNA-binding transcriptional regulator/antitoxin component of YhaV-PrlF toxin-antitoxin module